jgi:hypothetical protein
MSLLTFMEFEEFGSVRENGGGYCRLLWTVLEFYRDWLGSIQGLKGDLRTALVS